MPNLEKSDIEYLLNSKTHGYFKAILPIEELKKIEISDTDLSYFRAAIKLGLKAENFIVWNTSNNTVSFVTNPDALFKRLKNEHFLNEDDINFIKSYSKKAVDISLLYTKYKPERLSLLRSMMKENINVVPILDPNFSDNFIMDYRAIEFYSRDSMQKKIPYQMKMSLNNLKYKIYEEKIETIISECKSETNKKLDKDTKKYIEDINQFRYKIGLINEPYDLYDLGIDERAIVIDFNKIDIDNDSFCEEKKLRDPWQNNIDRKHIKPLKKCISTDVEERS